MPSGRKPMNIICSIEGCGAKHWGRGYCKRHYGAFRHHGDPLGRKKPLIEFNGQKKTIADWARGMDISAASLSDRLQAGWPVERALTEPRGKFGPRRAKHEHDAR